VNKADHDSGSDSSGNDSDWEIGRDVHALLHRSV